MFVMTGSVYPVGWRIVLMEMIVRMMGARPKAAVYFLRTISSVMMEIPVLLPTNVWEDNVRETG